MNAEWTALCAAIGLKGYPRHIGRGWDGFQAVRADLMREPVIAQRDLEQYGEWFGFDAALTDSLCRLSLRMEQDVNLKTAAVFLHWALFMRQPYYTLPDCPAPEPAVLGAERGLFAILVLTRQVPFTLRELAQRRLPDTGNVKGNFKSLKSFSQAYFRREGRWGMDLYFWNALCVTPYLNTVHYLRFNPVIFPWRYTLYRNRADGRWLCLADGGLHMRADGQTSERPDDRAFTTIRRRDGKLVTAHRVSPAGFVRPAAETFSLDGYERMISRGDALLSFHIPTGPGYTVAECKQSFVEAFAFFDRHFPEVGTRGIYCSSWLFSPQLQFILDARRSRIADMQAESFLLPIYADKEDFATFVFRLDHMPDDPGDLPHRTSLQAGLRSWLMLGGYLTVGGMLLPRGEVDHFGSHPHDKAQDLAEFRRYQTAKGAHA